ncbi:MAG: type I-E CRISPR-associated protein Cas6/Cse3/CasE [Verrucomicrobia bacterium]|nr:type I-E CRISPR-associated protein Cas6/Cse3/CasE [Verrucomicrobiota bacterium]
MQFTILHTRPDPVALTHWATRRQLLSPDGDFGYAFHALLAAAFNGNAPSPFRYMDEQGLLAYSNESESAVRERITHSSGEARKALGLDTLRVRPFPIDWQSGKRLAFEVLVRPIIRTKAGKERDLYQYRMEQRAEDSADEKPSREAIYRHWVAERFAGDNAAKLLSASMHGFALRRVIRRVKSDEAGARKPRSINGPDAMFRGELEIDNPIAFSQMLAHGIGRHRAFGYGMLLLKPSQRG